MTRYKAASENAEKVEDELKAEKRKLQREVQWPKHSAFNKKVVFICTYNKMFIFLLVVTHCTGQD